MLSTVRRIIVAILACGAAYAAYALLAVPAIEPQVVRRSSTEDTPSSDVPGGSSTDAPTHRFSPLLEQLFPPEAWQVQRPKVAEDDGFVFLFRDFRQLPEGQVELKPCTLIVLPKEADGSDPPAHAVPLVVTAEEGALLQFDNEAAAQRGRFGKFQSGRLPGEVRVYRPESAPGAGDALSLVTRNIQIDAQRIWTPHEVNFRYGASYGSGRDLVITLLPGAGNSGGASVSGAALNGIKFVELVHLDKLHLELPRERAATRPDGDEPAALPHPTDQSGFFAGPADAPLEITCQGSFRMDIQERVASFDDRVEVLRVKPDGPSDQLTCQLLLIHFVRPKVVLPATPDPLTPPQIELPESADRGGLPVQRAIGVADPATPPRVQPTSGRELALDVERIVATGHPVILHAVSVGARARGERLEYSVARRLLHLEDSQSAVLEQAGQRIEAPQLQYQLADDPSRLGRAWASGPGRLTRQDGQEAPLETTWGEELRLRPQGDLHVLSLRGGTSLRFPGFGQFASEAVHVWLRETTDDQGKLTIAPDRLLSQGNVTFDSPRLAGTTRELQAWFRPASGDEAIPPGRPVEAGAPGPGRSISYLPGTPLGAAASRMNVTGDLLRVQVLFSAQRSRLDQVSVQGQVRVTQTGGEERPEDRLSIEGAELHVDDADTQQAILRIVGEAATPARVQARGMTLTGPEIHLSQGDNRLWIDGPGSMTLPPLETRPKPRGTVLFENPRPLPPAPGGTMRDAAEMTSRPAPFTITWKGRLDFDGQQARFQRDVQARGVHRLDTGEILELLVLGGLLDVTLSQRLKFDGSPPPENLGLGQLLFGGHIYLEGQTLQSGTVTGRHKMQLHNLSLDQLSGRLHGDGPGWLNSVRLDEGQFASALSGRTAGGPAPPMPMPMPTSGPQLIFLHVEFSRAVDGNVTARHVEFTDQVQAIFGPVSRWDEELDWRRPETAGEQGATLRCQRLAVGQLAGGNADSPAVELEATGSAVVEGQKFLARGARISYSQTKDLLLLAGDGRSDAEFFRKPSANPLKPDTVARTIMYWRRDNRLEISGGKYIDLSPYTSDLSPPPRRP
ncbi:MAG: hypothetical protein U0935_14560 [Pirellulales bacterium]